jgi:hypothetical protein
MHAGREGHHASQIFEAEEDSRCCLIWQHCVGTLLQGLLMD